MIRTIGPEHAVFIRTAADLGWLARITWDACVIGSGPGGAVAAAVLAQSGWRVLLVERGGAAPHPDAAKAQYLDKAMQLGRLSLTRRARVALYQGNGLGGASIMWGAVAMRAPDFIFDEWRRLAGLDVSASLLAPHYDAVGCVLSATPQHADAENGSNAIVRRMAVALGNPDGVETVHRYTAGCRAAGRCTTGCSFGLKGTMLNSFLPLGLQTGNLTIVTGCEVRRFETDSASPGDIQVSCVCVAPTESPAGTAGHHRIRARVTIVAAGAVHSSALLLRTPALAARIRPRPIGLQPHAAIHAAFDEPISPPRGGASPAFDGIPAIYQFTGMLRDRHYMVFASARHRVSLATAIADLPPDDHAAAMADFDRTAAIALTLRDRPAHSRLVRRGHQFVLDYRESERDRAALRRGLADVSRALLAVGARRVFLPLLDAPTVTSERDVVAIERHAFAFDRAWLYADHVSGGNGMGADARLGVTDSDGRVLGTRNVYIADASLFPSPCGVSPSWTLMALSHKVASGLAARGAARS